MLSGYALLSALVIADVFTCDKGNQTTIRSSYRLGAFAYPDERAVLTDPTHFPPLLVPEALHARFEVLLGGLLYRERTLSARIGQPMHSPGGPVALRRTYRRQVW